MVTSADCDSSPSTLLPSDDTLDSANREPEELEEAGDLPGISSEGECPSSPANSDLWRRSSADVMRKAEAMLNAGSAPLQVITSLFPEFPLPPRDWSDGTLMSLLAELLDTPPRRNKLPQFNTFQDAIQLFRTRKNILILTGAGVSVSCGIPDFRSKDGIYARLHEDFPDLPDPTAMFDIAYFRKNPAPFYDFAKEIFPGQFEPSISHKFIKCLEDEGRLLRNYSQNIDTLELQTGITRVVECHGSFSKATCLFCRTKFEGDIIRDDVLAKRIPRCPKCVEGIIKPDIVFFGEDLSEEFHRQMAIDRDKVDLLVVIGSSLKVRPVSLIPFSVDLDVPQILINREPLNAYTADIELLGNCDDIIADICLALGPPFSNIIAEHEKIIHRRSEENSAPELPSSSNAVTLPPRSGEFSRKRRREIPQEEFFEMMKRLDEDETARINEQTCEHSDGEPENKRPHLETMYQRRYVSIESQLPNDAYFVTSSNRSIFPGAELHYDLEDQLVVTVSTRYKRASGWCSDEESECDESECDSPDDDGDSDDSSDSRPSSLPAIGSTTPIERSRRCSSCSPTFDTREKEIS